MHMFLISTIKESCWEKCWLWKYELASKCLENFYKYMPVGTMKLKLYGQENFLLKKFSIAHIHKWCKSLYY